MFVKLSANQEDYLETISLLIAEKGTARVKDVAMRLGVTSASVNGAIRVLSESGYVLYSPYESLRLTKKGSAYALKVSERHVIIQKFLTEVLQIGADEAQRTACCMEHVVTDVITGRIKMLTDYIQKNSADGNGSWKTKLDDALEGGSQ